MRATDQALADDPKRRDSDPTLPVFQWAAHHDIVEEEKRFLAGDKVALLGAIATCVRTGIVVPCWAAIAYLKAYRKVAWCKVKSWDDAFGAPYRKGTNLDALRRKRDNRWGVWLRVRHELRTTEVPIERIFDEIAREFGLNTTLVKELYYGTKRVTTWADDPRSNGFRKKRKTSDKT